MPLTPLTPTSYDGNDSSEAVDHATMHEDERIRINENTVLAEAAIASGAAAGGDLTGTYPNPTVAALAITDAKVATANKDGVAGTASMRTLGTGAQQAAAGNDSRLSDARTPTGAAGGDLGGTYPNPTVTDDSHAHTGATLTLADDSVTDAKLRESAAVSVIGRSANSTGNPADIAAGANGRYLTRQGDALSFAAVLEADITDSTILARVASAETISGVWSFNGGSLLDKASQVIDPRHPTYGAVFDNATTDDTTAIQAALDAVPASNASANTCTVVYISGTCKVSSLTLTNPTVLAGRGKWQSVIVTSSATATVLTCGGSGFHTIRDLLVTANTARTAGEYIKIGTNNNTVNSVGMYYPFGGIRLTDSSCAQTMIWDVDISFPDTTLAVAAGSYGVKIESDTTDSTFLADVLVKSHASRIMTYGIWVTEADAVLMTNCEVLGCINGLYLLAAASSAIVSLTVNQCGFDQSTTGYNILIDASAGSSSITKLVIANTWASAAGATANILINGSGVNGVLLWAMQANGAVGASSDGLNIAAGSNIRVLDGEFGGCGRDGIRVAANLSHIMIRGNTCGPISGHTFNTGYGINVLTGTGNYLSITHNNVLNSGGGGTFNNGATGANNITTPNIGVNTAADPLGGIYSLSSGHGAADHTDRTRYIWLPTREWTIETGAPAVAASGSAGSPLRMITFAFDGSADEWIGVSLYLPADWANGSITAELFWAPSDTTAGDVYWNFIGATVAAGEQIDQNNEWNLQGQFAAGGTAEVLKVSSLGTFDPGTGPLFCRFNVGRIASNVLDTYNGVDALFVGLLLSYTADM